MIEQGFKENEITEKLIEENRNYYFHEYLYDDRSSCIGLLDISFIFDQIWSVLISL